MPQIVEHPELGEIEFPDGMSEQEILAAIEKHSNQGFEQPMPGDDDLSQGLPAGGEPPRAPVPLPPTTAGMFVAPPVRDRLPLTPLPPLPRDTLSQPYNYVPQDVGDEPITVGTFDAAKKADLARIDAYYNGLKGSDPEKNAQLEAERQAALKAEGVRIVGEDPFKLKLPRVESSDLQTLGLGKTASDVAAGLQHAAVGGAEFFGSPEGVALLSTGKLPVPSDMHRLIAGGFSAQMASQLPGQIKESVKAWREGDIQRATELTASTVLSGLFAKEGAEAARGPAVPKVNPLHEIARINAELPNAEPAYGDYLKKKQDAIQKRVDDLENSLKDAGDAVDQPVQFSSIDPTTGQPWEPGQYAKIAPDGTLHVEPHLFHEILKDLSPAKQKKFIESLVDEEFVHKHVEDADALSYWQTLSPAEQATIRKRYAGADEADFSDTQFGHEAIRARLQQLSAVTPREIAEARGLAIEPRTLLAIESILRKVRKITAKDATAKQQEIFDRVQKTVEAARSKLGINAERTAIDAGDEGITPAATSENVPFAFSARRTPAIEGAEDMMREGIGLKDQTRRSYALGKQVSSKAEVKDLIHMRELKKDEFNDLRAKLQTATKEERMKLLMDPAIGEQLGTLGIHGGQLFNEILEKATGSVPSKMEPGEKAPVPMTQAEIDALTSQVRKEIDASKNATTAEVHGDVQSQPVQGKGEVPAAESGGGVQPREGAPEGSAAQENAPEVLRLEQDKKTAAAFRKKTPNGSEEELPLTPGSKEAPRNTAELGLPQHEREAVTPAKVADLTTQHLDVPKPSFERFLEDAREKFGNLQPGQLAEAWEDAVWKKLMAAPGSELESLIKKFGLIDRVGEGAIPDAREKTQARASSTEMFPKPELSVTEHPPRRLNAIARLGEKLIGQATKKSADLKRKGVSVQDIGWWRPKVGELPAFREISAEEVNSQAIGKILTEGGGMERGGKKTTSGLKGYPESVTKRLVALQDRATGRMELVSVYRTGRGTVYAADPQKGGERVHTPLPEILGKKTIAGEARYVPRFSVLLDEPVQGFKESFKSEADFQERFGAEAAEEAQRREEAEAGAEEIAPGVDRGPEKGVLFRREKTSPDSFRALHDILSGGEEMTQESLQENLESLFSENRPKDRKTGQPRALTIRELKGVDALLWAQDRMMEMAREKGTPIAPEAALSNLLEYLHENKDLSRSEFAAKAIRELSSPERPIRPKTEQLPGGTKAGSPASETPAAFRKPTKDDLKYAAWQAEKLWTGLREQVGAETLRNPIAAQITRWRDAADNIPANAGRKAESAILTELDHDTDITRAAVLAYRETKGGDPVLLDDAKAAVESGLATFRAEKNAEAVRQGELMLKAIEAVRADKSRFEKANDAFSAQVDAEAKLEKSKDIALTEKENYTPHVYNADGFSDVALLFPSRILGHKFTAAQNFGSYFSAYAQGFYPKKYDAAAVLGNRIRRGQKQVQYRVWLDRVKNTIDPHSGAPIAMEAEPYEVTRGGKTVTEYKPPTPEYDMFIISPGQRPIAVRKSYIGLMKVLTMRGPFAESEHPVARGIMNLNGFLKHGVILIFDTFHPSRIAQFGAATIGMRPKFWEAGNRGASALDYADAQMDKALAKGWITQDSVDWARQTETVRLGGATVDLSHRAILEEFERQGLNVGRISDALYRQLTDQIPVVGSMNRWTFDKLTRGLMAESAVSEFIRLNKKFPNYDARKLMGDVTRDLNFRFGNIGRQGAIRNPALREISQLLLLAPSWVEGMVQTEARFYARLLKAPFKMGSEKPNMGTIGHVMGRGLAAYFVLTQAMNIITKGHPTWMNEEDHKMDAWIPDVTGKTPGFWFSSLSVFAEITHDIVKYIHQSDKSIDAIARIIGNKLGPMGRVLSTFMFRENPQGEKITTTGGVIKQAASELAPAPISLAKGGQAIGHAIAPGTIPPTKPGDVQRQLAASAGFKIDPAQTAMRRIQEKAGEFMKKNAPHSQESVETLTDQAFLTQLRRAVRDGQEKEAMRLIEKLREGRSDREIEKAMQRYAKRHFTGSLKMERAFVDSLSAKDQELYDKAREEKAAQFDNFVTLWDKRPERKE